MQVNQLSFLDLDKWVRWVTSTWLSWEKLRHIHAKLIVPFQSMFECDNMYEMGHLTGVPSVYMLWPQNLVRTHQTGYMYNSNGQFEKKTVSGPYSTDIGGPTDLWTAYYLPRHSHGRPHLMNGIGSHLHVSRTDFLTIIHTQHHPHSYLESHFGAIFTL